MQLDGKRVLFVFAGIAITLSLCVQPRAPSAKPPAGSPIADIEPVPTGVGRVHPGLSTTGATVPEVAPSALTASHNPCVIRGLVRGLDGTPAADVDLSLGSLLGIKTDDLEESIRRGSSDEKGRFELEVPPGDYFLSAQGETATTALVEPISLAPGEEVRDLELRLEPAVHLSGQVIDQAGEPVEASLSVRLEGHRRPYLTRDTAANGVFDLGLLPQAPFTLVARARASGANVERRLERAERDLILRLGAPLGLLTFEVVDEAGAPVPYAMLTVRTGDDGLSISSAGEDGIATYQPTTPHLEVRATSDDAASDLLKLEAGWAARTLRLKMLVASSVSGRILLSDGRPAAGNAALRLVGKGEPSTLVAQTGLDENGQYRFSRLRAGTYVVRYLMDHANDADEGAASELRVVLGEHEDRALSDLRLLPDRRVRGVVLDENGAPVAGASLDLVDAGGASIHPASTLSRVSHRGRTYDISSQTVTDDDGRFVIERVRGPIRLRATGEDNAMSAIVSAASSGDEELTIGLLPCGNLDGVLRGRYPADARVRCSNGIWHEVGDSGEYGVQCASGDVLEIEAGGELRRFPIDIDTNDATYAEIRWD